jgi:hypothetical protein
MVLPAAAMDYETNKRITELAKRVELLEEWVRYFIERDKILNELISDLRKRSLPPPPKSIAQSSSES